MTPEEILNAIVDEVEWRVASALGLEKERVYETRSTGDQEGAAAYVSVEIPEMTGATQCADRAVLEFLIGFELFDDGERPRRIQRVEKQMAIRKALTWGGAIGGTPIGYAKLPQVTDMPVSEMGEPKDAMYMGGLGWRCQVDLPRVA